MRDILWAMQHTRDQKKLKQRIECIEALFAEGKIQYIWDRDKYADRSLSSVEDILLSRSLDYIELNPNDFMNALAAYHSRKPNVYDIADARAAKIQRNDN